MMARTPRTLPCYLDFDGFCDSCGDCRNECKSTHMGNICTECRTLCALCQDWLLTSDVVTLDGQRFHVGCASELDSLTDELVSELTISPLEIVMMSHYSDLNGGDL